MYRILLISSLILIFTSSNYSNAQQSPSKPFEKDGWVLTFQDEFESADLDTSKWIPRYLGFRTSPHNANSNYFFRDGCLVLQVTDTMPWKVSSIQTAQGNFHQWKRTKIDHYEPYKVKFSQEYGYFEIRAKCQKDRSGHSAFWLNSTDTTQYSKKARRLFDKRYWRYNEIDVFENYKGNKYKFNLLSPPNVFNRKEKPRKYDFNYFEDFHIYALEWDKNHVRYYVDHELMVSYRSNKIVAGPMFIYLSLYVNSWGGDSDPEYPVEFEIDYIRVYMKKKAE